MHRHPRTPWPLYASIAIAPVAAAAVAWLNAAVLGLGASWTATLAALTCTGLAATPVVVALGRAWHWNREAAREERAIAALLADDPGA